jgi:hypothetical protein
MMKHAERAKALARHRAIDLAVNKTLSFDILHQLRSPGALCSNDAKSCYDLIGHTTASIAMQRMGVLKAVVDFLFTTLQTAKRQVCAGYGNLITIGGIESGLDPMHGIRQGNGAEPPIMSGHNLYFVSFAFVIDPGLLESNIIKNDKKYWETYNRHFLLGKKA